MYNFFVITALFCAISSQNILAMELQVGNEEKKVIGLLSRRSSQEGAVADEKIWREGKRYEQNYSGPEDEKFIELRPSYERGDEDAKIWREGKNYEQDFSGPADEKFTDDEEFIHDITPGNFIHVIAPGIFIHIVTQGELLCASGVLNYKQLKRMSEIYEVRTVVTLDQDPIQNVTWALQGLSIKKSRDKGLRSENKSSYKSVHIPMSDGLAAKEHVEKLQEVFSDDEKYPRPILVCCADVGEKVGFAVAYWQLMIKNKPLSTALKQLMIVEEYESELVQMHSPRPKIFMTHFIASKKMDWDDTLCKRMYNRYVRDHRLIVGCSVGPFGIYCCICIFCCYCWRPSYLPNNCVGRRPWGYNLLCPACSDDSCCDDFEDKYPYKDSCCADLDNWCMNHCTVFDSLCEKPADA